MLIAVTADDIENGDPNTCTTCPVARALARATGVPWFVGADAARPIYSSHGYIPLPVEVVLRIAAFDRGEVVEPFTFDFPTEVALQHEVHQ